MPCPHDLWDRADRLNPLEAFWNGVDCGSAQKKFIGEAKVTGNSL